MGANLASAAMVVAIKNLSRIATGGIAGALAYMLLGYEPDDEEEKEALDIAKEFAGDTLETWVGTLPLADVPLFVGRMAMADRESAGYEEFRARRAMNSQLAEIGENALSILREWKKENPDWWFIAMEAADAISSTTGAPGSAPVDEFVRPAHKLKKQNERRTGGSPLFGPRNSNTNLFPTESSSNKLFP